MTASRRTADGSSLVTFVDSGTSPAPTGVVIASAPPDTAFRGVAMSPHD